MSFARWWWTPILILGAIAGAVPAVLISARSDDTYKAEAILLVVNETGVEASERLTATVADLAESRTVINQVRLNLGLDLSDDRMRDKISVTTNFDSQLVTVGARDTNADVAAAMANATAASLVQRTTALLPQTTPTPVTTVPETATPLPQPNPTPLPVVRLVEEALPPTEPSNSATAMNAVLGGALGLVVAASICIGIDSFRRASANESS